MWSILNSTTFGKSSFGPYNCDKLFCLGYRRTIEGASRCERNKIHGDGETPDGGILFCHCSDIRHFYFTFLKNQLDRCNSYFIIFTKVWYQSPYPEEYTVLPKIYICEFCLKYMKVVPCCELFKLKCTVYILWHFKKKTKNPNKNSTRRRV